MARHPPVETTPRPGRRIRIWFGDGISGIFLKNNPMQSRFAEVATRRFADFADSVLAGGEPVLGFFSVAEIPGGRLSFRVSARTTMECATPMRPPTSSDAEAPDYQPSPQERSTLETYLQRISEHAPRMKVGEATGLAPDHPEPAVGQVLLMAALGTADHDFYGGLVRQLGEACVQDGAVDERALNFMLSVVKGIKPRDQVEAMLAAQMAAVHMATLACARRLARAEAPSDGAERALNRLSRTYVAQMDALARYRAGDEHDVSRPELPAGEGGEAILGDGTQAPPVEASDAAVTRAEGRRTAVARVAAPRTAARRTEGARAILRTQSALGTINLNPGAGGLRRFGKSLIS